MAGRHFPALPSNSPDLLNSDVSSLVLDALKHHCEDLIAEHPGRAKVGLLKSSMKWGFALVLDRLFRVDV